jgi:hypothetical protein
VLSGPSALAKPLPSVRPANHRGLIVCRVPAWPGTRQSMSLPCFRPGYHTLYFPVVRAWANFASISYSRVSMATVKRGKGPFKALVFVYLFNYFPSCGAPVCSRGGVIKSHLLPTYIKSASIINYIYKHTLKTSLIIGKNL